MGVILMAAKFTICKNFIVIVCKIVLRFGFLAFKTLFFWLWVYMFDSFL